MRSNLSPEQPSEAETSPSGAASGSAISGRILPLILRLFLYTVGLLLSAVVMLILIAFLYLNFGKVAAIIGVVITDALLFFWIYECARYVIRWRKVREEESV